MFIITGMHRSGTSFVCRLLGELNMDVGSSDHLLAADDWNEEGYFENKEIVALNNSLILGDWVPHSYWTERSGPRPFRHRLLVAVAKSQYLYLPRKKLIAARAQRRAQEIQWLAQRFSGMAVKDPRFSITLDHWRRLGGVERVLFVFRHPLEVADSLWRRDRLPVPIGLYLWKYHVKAFLEATKDAQVVYVDYNAFFRSDEALNEMRQLYHFAGRPFDDSEADALLRAIRDSSLKHSSASGGALPAGVGKLYDTLGRRHGRSTLDIERETV